LSTTKTTADEKARAAYIQGLRELADFLEAHPDLPMPFWGVTVNVYAQTKEEFVDWVGRVGGPLEKRTLETVMSLGRRFGVHKYEVNIMREQILGREVQPEIERFLDETAAAVEAKETELK
jgi:hypothetical protein